MENDSTRELKLRAAIGKLTSGIDQAVIVSDLKRSGMSLAEAEDLVTEAHSTLTNEAIDERKKNIKTIITSIAAYVIGVGVTLWSLSEAASSGGSYRIVYGLIVAGFIFTAVGFYRMSQGVSGKARMRWMLTGVITLGLMVGGGLVAYNMVDRGPTDEDIEFIDASGWLNAEQNLFLAQGDVTNLDENWTVRNVTVLVHAENAAGIEIAVLEVEVSPLDLAPGEHTTYSEQLQMPAGTANISLSSEWEWIAK